MEVHVLQPTNLHAGCDADLILATLNSSCHVSDCLQRTAALAIHSSCGHVRGHSSEQARNSGLGCCNSTGGKYGSNHYISNHAGVNARISENALQNLRDKRFGVLRCMACAKVVKEQGIMRDEAFHTACARTGTRKSSGEVSLNAPRLACRSRSHFDSSAEQYTDQEAFTLQIGVLVAAHITTLSKLPTFGAETAHT